MLQAAKISSFIARSFRNDPLNRRIVDISLPAMLTMVNHTIVMVTDTAMVGLLGAKAIAAAGLGGFIVFTTISVFFGVSIAIQIIIARRFGEKKYARSGQALVIALIMSLILGSLISISAFTLSSRIANLMSSDNEVTGLLEVFMKYRFIGLLGYFLTFIYRGFFDGIGKTRVSLLSATLGTVSNIFFNWLLIYGHWGFPQWGVKGAAIASSFASIPALLVFIIVQFRKQYRYFFLTVKLKEMVHSAKGLVKEIVYISLPLSLDNLLLHLSFVLLLKIADLIGPVSLAASNILIAILSLSFMPGYALGVGATTILGNAMGRRQYKLAAFAVKRSALFAAMLMTTMGVIFIVFGRFMLTIFTDDVHVIDDAYHGLVIVSLAQTFDAYQMVYGSALRSAGLVYWVLRFYFIISYLVMLPIAYLFAIHLGWGTTGMWLGISVWMSLLALGFVWRFSKNDWQTIEV